MKHKTMFYLIELKVGPNNFYCRTQIIKFWFFRRFEKNTFLLSHIVRCSNPIQGKFFFNVNPLFPICLFSLEKRILLLNRPYLAGQVQMEIHCTALHCTALHCTPIHYIALLCYIALYCTALQCTALHVTTLHCTAQHCTSLHFTILHNNALPCNIALYCTTKHCTSLELSLLH